MKIVKRLFYQNLVGPPSTLILALLCWFTAIVTLNTSCQQEPRPVLEQCRKVPNRSQSLVAWALVKTKVPTFDDDIAPMVESSIQGRVYKCTTCHPEYKDYNYMKDKKIIDEMIRVVQPGLPFGQRMPLNGTWMSQEDQDILKSWVQAGFPQNQDDLKEDSDPDQEEDPVSPDDGYDPQEQGDSSNQQSPILDLCP